MKRGPTQQARIAFVMDERLPHVRKAQFTKFISLLRIQCNLEVFSPKDGVQSLLQKAGQGQYSLILLPWHLYLDWKQLDAHFGALRLEGVTVAGYFADTLLPFDLNTLPNFHRMILLDFFRMTESEIVTLITALVYPDQKTGFSGIVPRQNQIYHQEWYEHDRSGTHCLDSVMSLPLLRARRWEDRVGSIRFVLTALWLMCFKGKSRNRELDSCATLELAEYDHRIALKFTFQDRNLNLKHLMEHTWPASGKKHPLFQILSEHSDFLRIHQFPENHTLEITLFFTAEAPSMHHPGEVRGIWIEPQKTRYLTSNSEEEGFENRIPVLNAQERNLPDQFLILVDQLNALHCRLGESSQEERFIVEHQISNVRRLLSSIEKKLAETKKIA